MSPCLAAGDEVLVRAQDHAEPGQIVVAHHPYKPSFMVKRVEDIDERGYYDLRGDNPSESTDSRSLGMIPKEKLIGVVTSRFKAVGTKHIC